jgi:hypothetical protein
MLEELAQVSVIQAVVGADVVRVPFLEMTRLARLAGFGAKHCCSLLPSTPPAEATVYEYKVEKVLLLGQTVWSERGALASPAMTARD